MSKQCFSGSGRKSHGKLKEGEDKETCSPTTSTPGNSPIPNQGIIKASELHDSEESIIEPATPVCRMKTTPKIIGRKIEMTPYMNNSVDTNVTQDTTDADWETSQDITEITVINGEIRSSIAQRTRSKTEQIRETNMSGLKGNCNKTMEKSFEVFNDKENNYIDTKYTEARIKEEEWSGKNKWVESLSQLNTSLEYWGKMDYEDKLNIINALKLKTTKS